MEKIKKLAIDHWEYNKKIIEISFVNEEYIPKSIAINLMGYFYKSAMIHGVKHGENSKK